MRGFLAIAWREVAERRMVFVAMALAATFPFLFPLFLGALGDVLIEVRGMTSVVVLVVASWGLSVILGATLFDGSMKNRLGFHFSRPVDGLVLWSGKLSGAVILVTGSAAVLMVPTYLAAAICSRMDTMPGYLTTLAIILSASFCMPFFHVLAVAIRSRSSWLLLDILGLLVTGLLLSPSLVRMYAIGAEVPILFSLGFLGVMVVSGSVFASMSAVRIGRTSRRAAHRIASINVGVSLVLGVLVISGYTVWVIGDPEFEDLTEFRVRDVSGDWLAGSGTARGSHGLFVYHLEDGSFHKLSPQSRSTRFSPSISDSRIAVSADSDLGYLNKEILIYDLHNGAPPHLTVSLERTSPDWFSLSPRAGYLADISDGYLTIYNIDDPDDERVTQIYGNNESFRAFFVDEGHLRIYRFSRKKGHPGPFDALEYDIRSDSLQTLWTMADVEPRPHLSIDVSGDHLLFSNSPRGVDG